MKVINRMTNTVINGAFYGGDSYINVGNGSRYNSKNMKKFKYNEEFKIPAKDAGKLKTIKVEAGAVSVMVETGRDEVAAQVYGYSVSEKQYNIGLSFHQGMLYIKVSYEGNVINESDINILVTIPEEILLQDFRMDVSDGDICIKCNKIVSERMEIQLSAGNLKTGRVLPSKKINMEINAGSAKVEGKIEADTIINSNINSGSMEVFVENVSMIFPDIKLNAASQHFSPTLDGKYKMNLKADISCGSLKIL